ncbi:MAG: alpha/beta fold hydrolase [Chloroflexota bacterium]
MSIRNLQAREEYVAHFPAGRRSVMAAGCNTHIYEAGEGGVPLVFLHGGIVEAATWLQNVIPLAHGRTVIAPDLPAHGLSDYLPPAKLLVWFESLVDKLGLDRFDLCGHSTGGGLAVRYAAAHPERVRRLILCAPTSLGLVFPRFGPLLWAGSLPSPAPFTDLMIEHVWGDPGRLSPELRKYFCLFMEDMIDSGRWWWYLSGGWRWMLDAQPRDLTAISVPTLLLWGGRDRIVPRTPRIQQFIARHLPQARLHVFETSGHMPQLECEEEFNAVVKRFVSHPIERRSVRAPA